VRYRDSGCKKHGKDGSSKNSFRLGDDEYVTGIRDKSGSKDDRIQFFLDIGRASPQYGQKWGVQFTIKKYGMALRRLFGRSDSLLEQIGVFFIAHTPTIMPAMKPSVSPTSVLQSDAIAPSLPSDTFWSATSLSNPISEITKSCDADYQVSDQIIECQVIRFKYDVQT